MPATAEAHGAPNPYPLSLNSLNVQNPFVFADPKTRTYYLYAQSPDPSNTGIVVYRSKNLKSWSAPATAYTVPSGAWNADEPATAPEVAAYHGKYYLFTTLHNSGDIIEHGGTSNRFVDTSPEATIVAVSDSPAGPFADVNPKSPPTDLSLMTMDGTLYVDPDGVPYLVYAHDWVQKIDGTLEAVQLDSSDLSSAAGTQFFLFKGSDAAFYQDRNFGSDDPTYNAANTDQLSPFKVYDPQVTSLPDGGLVMLWTTQKQGQYVEMQAVSRTGNIRGPWEQEQALLTGDKGGAMSFETFDGTRMLLAQDNMTGGSGHIELYNASLTATGFQLDQHRADLDGVRSISLRDTTPPDIYVPSTRVVTTSSARATSASVHFVAYARDDRDGWVPVTYSTRPDSSFKLGRTTVTVHAKDSAGNRSSESFVVQVQRPSSSTTAAQPKATDPTALATSFPLTMPQMTLHDPYILPDETSHTYFLYTANSSSTSGDPAHGIMAYQSKDLIHWSVPKVVYTVPTSPDAWNDSESPWAPEVHLYDGKYYLFTTLHNPSDITDPSQPGPDSTRWIATYRRASILAVADSPVGPFVDMNVKAPLTDPTFDTLDGTLYVDPTGKPYLVFANEWLQKLDGTIDALPLSNDLSTATGEPIFMWKSSDAPWYKDPLYGGRYTTVTDDKQLSAKQLTGDVTDGPELYTTPDGSLVSMWATYRDDTYIETQAISRTGNIAGPWEQLPPLVWGDKGHGMVFQDFNGDMHMIMHNHMSSGTPRGEIYDMQLTNDGFKVLAHREDLDGVAGVDITDNLAPKIYVPSTRVVNTSSRTGAAVSYFAEATDDRDGAVAVQYSKSPGSRFPVGRSTVTVTARDAAGNVSHASFDVVVKRTSPAPGGGNGHSPGR
ncbi:hypothetical protein GCM10023322_70920 [Rugosimonospora acidiphila]|uniref:HYR domain-containing protein n=1 Tax=Rugosimonospora acidiphila TaxID=556531 RepID=A0ABP9SNB6_9ACTN